MSVLVMAAVAVDIYDGSLTAGMSGLVMMAEAVNMHGGSVDTVDWLLQICMNLALLLLLLLRIHLLLLLGIHF
jgi:hypothetical protein